ncbi:tRNA-specific 2-thiouridylase MnmA [bioreactor metagenome]|uniref:tRNA-specific 2-thiouridylase MnmA n=1 Tax=bioreactor metagenome TaxID=1076179 RepID=A0A644WDB8_9ZZZZ
MPKAMIAMSGGVDSSVAAFLCVSAGYECAGITMKLFDNEDIGIGREKTCCSVEDVEDARSVAYKLGIPYYVFNFSSDFNTQVIDKFISAYECGSTPNPCIDCNRYLKFNKLLSRRKELGYDFVATGHYARIEFDGSRYLLKKAMDGAKDQSYVLYMMKQEQLSHVLFPLGTYCKAETRKIAEENGFVTARKRESQDICFVPDGDYAKFIETRTGKHYPYGNFVDRSGNVLGEHKGIIRYTVGQRKGLSLSLPQPLYVCEERPEDNTIVLGDNTQLLSKSFNTSDFNWIACDVPPGESQDKLQTSGAVGNSNIFRSHFNTY